MTICTVFPYERHSCCIARTRENFDSLWICVLCALDSSVECSMKLGYARGHLWTQWKSRNMEHLQLDLDKFASFEVALVDFAGALVSRGSLRSLFGAEGDFPHFCASFDHCLSSSDTSFYSLLRKQSPFLFGLLSLLTEISKELVFSLTTWLFFKLVSVSFGISTGAANPFVLYCHQLLTPKWTIVYDRPAVLALFA